MVGFSPSVKKDALEDKVLVFSVNLAFKQVKETFQYASGLNITKLWLNFKFLMVKKQLKDFDCVSVGF